MAGDWRTANNAKIDPWAKLHEWRFSGPLRKAENVKHMFPGLGIALVAFSVYVLMNREPAKPAVSAGGSGHH